jgi:hypothetical protein
MMALSGLCQQQMAPESIWIPDEQELDAEYLEENQYTMQAYRKGAIGALMDEYERAALELKLLVEQTPDSVFIQVVDTQTKDKDCRSIQTILTHVVRAGYGYANYIRDTFSIPSIRPATRLLSRQEAVNELDAMLDYTAQTLDGKWEMTE